MKAQKNSTTLFDPIYYEKRASSNTFSVLRYA
ncbi:MAG: hypothetical protein ACI89U_002240, partial [Gammaproteobacteria bacterium]